MAIVPDCFYESAPFVTRKMWLLLSLQRCFFQKNVNSVKDTDQISAY